VVEYDLVNGQHTKDLDVEGPIDIIYHLGEYARVEKSLTEPTKVWDMNIAGTFGVVEYWKKTGCKLVYAGSSTKFGDGGLGRMGSMYAWSKASNTELVENYGRWYNLPYAITYFYNVYGPGERSDEYGTVIEIFRQKILKGEPLTVTTPGTQRRIFTHVDDIISGLLLVGESGEGNNYGLGADEDYSILEVASMFGGDIKLLPTRPGNRMSSDIDTSKSRALGWTPKNRLADYIKKYA
jgi:UDP-glucose 4-epimerase